MPPAPALNDLIRALENSTPDNELSNATAGTDATSSKGGGDEKVSAMASGLIRALETQPSDSELQNNIDATSSKVGEDAKTSPKTSQDNKIKAKKSVARKRPAVSDDDSSQKKKKAKLLDIKKSPIGNMRAAEKPTIVTMEDCISTIEAAVSEHRIDAKKAERLQECLESGDWSEVAFSLLCEQIPMKRKGKGYSCRVCQVPKKGHTCVYCHVCSTPEKKYKKDDEHVCINCPTCFEVGKKSKKLIQEICEGHVCPHGDYQAQLPKKVSVKG